MTVRSAILGLIATLTLLSVPAQMLIDPSGTNAASACIIAASSFGLLAYLTWSSALATHPLSTLTIIGLCFTSQLGALLIQTAALTPVSANLYDPLYTFGTLAFYQAIVLGVHAAYRFFSPGQSRQPSLFRGLLRRAGIYRVPPSGALWFMGFIGLATFVFSHSVGIVGKVATGFSFLAWSPFLILFFLRDVGPTYCNAAVHKAGLAAYVGVAVLMGLAFNTRAVMFQGVATIGLLYLLAGLRSTEPVTGRAVFRLCVVGVLLVALSVPASYLATAMVVARQMRSKLSATEMIATTVDVLSRPNLMRSIKAQGRASARFEAYDEFYVANPLLNRLVLTKYDDNAFHFVRTLTSRESKARLGEVSANLVWIGLPTPLLQKLGIRVFKDDFAFSMGDYLAYLSRGVPLGGRRIGSLFAQGIGLFGPLFPFVYALMCLAIFGLIDLLSERRAGTVAAVSTLGMLQIWTFFLSGISYEGLHVAMYFIFRNFWQMVLIYTFVLGITRLAGGRGHTGTELPPVATLHGS